MFWVNKQKRQPCCKHRISNKNISAHLYPISILMLLRLTGTVSRIVEYLRESNSRIDTTCGGFD